MFNNCFPISLKEDILNVLNLIPQKTYNNVSIRISERSISYLHNGTKISFPYRVYFGEIPDDCVKLLSENQQIILHCIYSRSCDGFVREKHIKALLNIDFPNWAIPFIFKVCDEYIVEILETVYRALKEKNTNDIKTFCIENCELFCKSYARMISYWNEFYRRKCYRYENYVGRKLFKECFGYSRSLERTI